MKVNGDYVLSSSYKYQCALCKIPSLMMSYDKMCVRNRKKLKSSFTRNLSVLHYSQISFACTGVSVPLDTSGPMDL